ncbi:hypothetical protein GXW83_00565 [Streptacidiphilus sp. PB12-B1b]|uniref:hypothetical protein n=1 Tax=Streptacidiphilus sp. PB12-B1b TaxID=2705012 RepID=UPI0015F7BDA9|nr:hypothetical protein [Streptacidiphilus sp. PB12-B1b]QMU74507.1 hypothetical protein GXW83_00565 [Streptacidiphilus sp. PB12-B1b]
MGRLPRPAHAVALDLRALRALPFASVCVVVSGLAHSLGGGGTVPLHALLVGGLAVWALATALAGRERSLGAIAAGLAVGQLGLHLYFHLSLGSMAGMSGSGSGSGVGSMAGMPGMAGMTAPGAAGGGQGSALTALALRLICGPAGASGTGGLPPGTTAGEIVSRAGLDPHLAVTALPQLDAWTGSAVLGLTPLMLLGHLLAALAAGWWLRRGEAAVWRHARVTVQLAETLARTHLAQLRTALSLLGALVRGLLGAEPDRPGGGTARDAAPRRLPRTALLRHQVVRRGPPALLTA